MNGTINDVFEPIVQSLTKILFWDPFAAVGFHFGAPVPFIVVWLIAGAIFFTFYLKFINFRGLKHGVDLALGRSSKFAECTLGVKYRKMSPEGVVSGGPMYYLRDGLKERGYKNFGGCGYRVYWKADWTSSF